MELFSQWLVYIRLRMQDVIDFIFSNWLLEVMFGLNVIYLLIVAIKLKRNTD